MLAGATGYIGSQVVGELLRAGYTLICPVRARPPRRRCLSALAGELTGAANTSSDPAAQAALAARLTLVPTTITDATALTRALSEHRADAVVSCIASRGGGIRDSRRVDFEANLNLLSWAKRRGVEHFTLLSAICVQKPRLAFQFEKLRFEAALAGSGLSHAIVRPTAFFKSLSGQVSRVQSGKPFLVFGGGELTRCKPIAEPDLARFIRMTLDDSSLRGVLPIGGPGPAISPLEQAQLLADLSGQARRTRSLNPALLAAAAGLLSAPGRLFPALADKAEFARIGHYYATESMLLWDERRQRYDADATPEFGEITLKDSYRAQLAGRSRQPLGAHGLFG